MNPSGVQPVPIIQTQCFQSAAPMPQIGPKSVHMMCQICGNDIYSKTSKKAKSSAWWSCLLLCIIGCSFGCCLIPCCMDSCNVVNHYCPKCNTYLGQYRP